MTPYQWGWILLGTLLTQTMQSLNDCVQANPDLGRTFHYLATMMTILMMLWKRISSGRYSTTLTYPLWSLVKLWLFMAQQEYQPASRACKRQNKMGHTMWAIKYQSHIQACGPQALAAAKKFEKKPQNSRKNSVTQESKSRIHYSQKT